MIEDSKFVDYMEGTNDVHETGFYQDITNVDRDSEFDPKTGEHCWVIVMLHKVNPSQWAPGDRIHFDKENLVSASGPSCYFCGKAYTIEIGKRRCKGRP